MVSVIILKTLFCAEYRCCNIMFCASSFAMSSSCQKKLSFVHEGLQYTTLDVNVLSKLHFTKSHSNSCNLVSVCFWISRYLCSSFTDDFFIYFTELIFQVIQDQIMTYFDSHYLTFKSDSCLMYSTNANYSNYTFTTS